MARAGSVAELSRALHSFVVLLPHGRQPDELIVGHSDERGTGVHDASCCVRPGDTVLSILGVDHLDLPPRSAHQG